MKTEKENFTGVEENDIKDTTFSNSIYATIKERTFTNLK